MSREQYATIIGFEGSWDPKYPAAWGAVAIRTGDVIRNSVTGRRIHKDEDLDGQVNGLYLVGPCEAPLDTQYAVAINQDGPYAHLFALDPNKSSSSSRVVGRTRLQFFSSIDVFNLYATDVALTVCDHFLSSWSAKHVASGPEVDLFWTVFAMCRGEVAQIQGFRLLLCSPEDREEILDEVREDFGDRFARAVRDFYEGLAAPMTLHLCFDGEDTVGGGLDFSTLSVVCSGIVDSGNSSYLQSAHVLKFPLKHKGTPEHKSPRFQYAKTGSAHLFVTADLPASLRERVARHLDLLAIKSSLDLEPGIKWKPKLNEAIRKVVSPSKGVSLTYGVGDVLHPPSWKPLETALRTTSLTLLGVVVSFNKPIRNVNVVVGAGGHQSISCKLEHGSAASESLDQSPDQWLHVPALCTITMHAGASGERYVLSRVERVQGPVEIDHIPSGILRGSFRKLAQPVAVSLASDQQGVNVEFVKPVFLRGLKPNTKEKWSHWNDTYRNACLQQELAFVETEFVAPARLVDPPSIVRILSVLAASKTGASRERILVDIETIFGDRVSLRNTAREVRAFPRFFVDVDGDPLVLNETGYGVASAIQRLAESSPELGWELRRR